MKANRRVSDSSAKSKRGSDDEIRFFRFKTRKKNENTARATVKQRENG
jgi:hypothetical protein